ncbi:hypothetical protein [Cupriavidus sp. D39]|uniref:hypothetical protein n=1 Tax=Cupriavidus sp. D39 TaxID=2997877 RepID=UPI00226E8293|nr:hypothetical protein [Cupriavidus sp. D39]MCY0858397.1 hypothetical protein [Cupriavidus sp. D39]
MPALPSHPCATISALLLGIVLACGGCAQLPRDINGSPPTARLVPNGVPPPPVTAEDIQKIDALNRQVLREQEAAIARQQQAEAMARAATYGYPSPSWNLYYGGWGGGHWGGGVGFSSPGYYRGWGGYPYWW